MASSSRRGRGRGRGGGRNEDPVVQLSKTLSYILRHGAKGEGFEMRPDGYVKLEDLLKRPKLRGYGFNQIREVVEENDKQRFTLLLEPYTTTSSSAAPDTAVPITIPSKLADDSSDILKDLDMDSGTWYIRANQGHSLKVEQLELKPVEDPSEIPIAIHGTTLKAWDSIKQKGLSIMGRNHVHLAAGKPGASGVLSGMRTSSAIHIYIDVEKAMGDGLKFFVSSNGVILTAGDEEGFLSKRYFSKVERSNGTPMPDDWRE
ncbi:related to TPT1-tRNA 2`-phosphotransferase [Serendipita indica DSM 11827]|uniref:2'-phosphotransferase n=1 Tax=Serendipita indica (strain DSM 11827) TaxID=1109443 RepID=G4TMT1_SERID|nr:related to TPT1-tRNA 2`-phosphotransferase [Serendipita indica DSM 11827]